MVLPIPVLRPAALHFVSMPPERFDWSDRSRPPQASPAPAGLAPAGLAEAAPREGGASARIRAPRPRGKDQAFSPPDEGRDDLPHRPGPEVRHRHDRLTRVVAACRAAGRRRHLDHRGPRQHQRHVPRTSAARPDRDRRGLRGPAGQPGRRAGPALRASGARGRGRPARLAPGRSSRHRPVGLCRSAGPCRPGSRAPRLRVLVATGPGGWTRLPAGGAAGPRPSPSRPPPRPSPPRPATGCAAQREHAPRHAAAAAATGRAGRAGPAAERGPQAHGADEAAGQGDAYRPRARQ